MALLIPSLVSIKNPLVDAKGKELYKSKDRDVCCTLAALDHKIVEVTHEGPGNSLHYTFFKDDIDTDLAKFITGDLLVPAHRLWAEWNRFKSVMNA